MYLAGKAMPFIIIVMVSGSNLNIKQKEQKSMKCLKKLGFIAAAMVAVVSMMSVNAFAQDEKFRFGVVGGLELSKLTASGGGVSSSSGTKTGFKVGVVGEYNFTESLALAPGLVLAQRGGKEDDVSWSLTYLQIPIDVKFSYPVGDEFKVFGLAGPYIGFGLSAKIKDGDNSLNLFSEDDLEEYGLESSLTKRTDFGLNFGGGVEYKKIIIGLQYDLGLSNLMSKWEDSSMKNRNFGFYVGYMF